MTRTASLIGLLALLTLTAVGLNARAAAEPSPAGGETLAPGTIVILNDAFFPYVKLTSVSPGDIAHAFERAGLACSLMDSKTILDQHILTEGPCRVLVTPFGNAFPQVLYAPLREFRKRGGIFVSTGIPLTHPLVPDGKGGWRDEGHTDALASAKGDGLGVGTFAGTAFRQIQPTELAQKLGLGVLDWKDYPLTEDLQGLDLGSLDKQAVTEPILTAPDGVPFAAIIFQHAPGREGAIDIWSGTTGFNTSSDIGGLIHAEVVVRATAYALMKKGLIDTAGFDAIAAMKPNELIFQTKPELFEPHFMQDRRKGLYPKAAEAPKGLIIFDDRKETLSPTEQTLAASIQGLFNAQPGDEKLMILWDKGDAKWAGWLESQHYVDHVEKIGSLKDLIQKSPTRRAVLYDESPSHLPNIALMVAACEKAVLVSDPAMLDRFGLQTAMDLRGRWKTNTEAYQWVLDNYGDQLSGRVVAIYHPTRSAVLRDYLVANKVFTFWVSGSGDGDLPGADRRAERALMTQVLSTRFPVNIPCLGYPWAGEGIGIGEGPGVTMLSRAGKFLVPSDLISNLSVMTLFPRSNEPIQPKIRDLKMDPGRSYAALVMSDGDNLCTWRDFFPGYWDELGKRDFPVGWTMGPSIVDLMPPIFDYVRKNLPVGDSIGGAVSGVGYVAMEEFGKNFGDQREAVVKEFMGLTGQYCRRAGEKWLWIMRYGKPGSQDLRAYTDWTQGIDTFMGGYGKITDSIDEAAEIMDGKVIFHAINGGDQVDGLKKQLDRLIERSRSQNKPFFVHWFLFNWGMPPNDLRTLGDYFAEKGVTLVTPEELNSLYRQSLETK